jgi:hypothetical protein
MNTNIKIIIVVFALFLLASAFGGLKAWQMKKMAAEKARLETGYDLLQKEKIGLQLDNVKLKSEAIILKTQKSQAEKKLADKEAEIAKQKKQYEEEIAGLKEIPTDSLYQKVFDKFQTFDGVLKYRFADNQVRNIYLGLLEKDHYYNLYGATGIALLDCKALNVQNDKIITNLGSQNENLLGQNNVLQQQIGIKESELKLSNKLLNRQKVKGFVFKSTTVLATIGVAILVLK